MVPAISFNLHTILLAKTFLIATYGFITDNESYCKATCSTGMFSH